MAISSPGKEWETILEMLNSALKNGGGSGSDNSALDFPLCGQTVRVVISEKESAQTTSTLRQLLLREIDKEVKALGR